MHKAIVETTVGDLIVAITDETHQQVRDEKITYELVAYILADLTKNCGALGNQQLAGKFGKLIERARQCFR